MKVKTSTGETFTAPKVVVTVPLGYVKKHHATLFTPGLPKSKLKGLDGLKMGVLDKVSVPSSPAELMRVNLSLLRENRRPLSLLIQPPLWTSDLRPHLSGTTFGGATSSMCRGAHAVSQTRPRNGANSTTWQQPRPICPSL